ncbi:DUF1643 domain-containing protein [Cyanobacteria bacterium FACHB-DQ100]|nr:DUF1643 domain-containing protein [Cyanobacteria bacterium FACHB-DQ100]
MPRVGFVLLNPNPANAEHNNPTIRRCIGFAKRWDTTLEVDSIRSR